MQSALTLLLVCVGAASGLFFGNGDGPAWNSLKTTWGPNPFSQDYFVKQPLTADEAKKDGYEQISTGCQGQFLGQRFIKNKDVGLILIYDIKGTIAGMQMAIPASMVLPKYYKFSEQRMYNLDTIAGIDVYVLTAYLVEPSTICAAGRNASLLQKEGTGTGVWLQNGTDPIKDSFRAPMHESETGNTKWVKGACFPSMGVHYWYDNRLDANCDLFFPTFLLYNKGKLTGLGWAAIGKYEFTKRTEFPPLAAILSFLKPVPTCMSDRYTEAGGFTTMHMYFNTEPLNLLC